MARGSTESRLISSSVEAHLKAFINHEYMVPMGCDRPAEIKGVGKAPSFIRRSTGSRGLRPNRSEAHALVAESSCAVQFHGGAYIKIENGVHVTSRCTCPPEPCLGPWAGCAELSVHCLGRGGK